MKNRSRFFKVLNKDGKERGASLVEYGLLVALIAVVGIPAVRMVGINLNERIRATEPAFGSADLCPPGGCPPVFGP